MTAPTVFKTPEVGARSYGYGFAATSERRSLPGDARRAAPRIDAVLNFTVPFGFFVYIRLYRLGRLFAWLPMGTFG